MRSIRLHHIKNHLRLVQRVPFALCTVLALILFASCTTSPQKSGAKKESASKTKRKCIKTLPDVKHKMTLFIVKSNGEKIEVKDQDVVKLKATNFTFTFPIEEYAKYCNRFRSVQVYAGEKPDIFLIKKGSSIHDTKFFAPGTGLASDADGSYHDLLVVDTGHHYLFYNPDAALMKRVNITGKLPNSLLQAEWKISKITTPDNKKITKTYVAFFQDFNLNEKIDADELIRFTIEYR